jgi:uncharacterized protein (DUF1330 family)
VPKAFVIVTEDIHDEDAMNEYNTLAAPTIGESGARVVAFQDDAVVLEGQWPKRTVMLEFDSVEAARSWYDSPGYQAAAKVRQAAATSNAVIIAGF